MLIYLSWLKLPNADYLRGDCQLHSGFSHDKKFLVSVSDETQSFKTNFFVFLLIEKYLSYNFIVWKKLLSYNFIVWEKKRIMLFSCSFGDKKADEKDQIVLSEYGKKLLYKSIVSKKLLMMLFSCPYFCSMKFYEKI